MKSADCKPSRLPMQLRVAAILVGARPRLLATWALVGLLAAGPALAGPLFSTPVYNPKTKSYFEYVHIPIGYSIRGPFQEINWERAEGFAKQQRYKGVHGRLAVIKSAATLSFLIETFQPLPYPLWIGLRYFCKKRTLVWSDGSHMTKSSYAAWGVPWHVHAACWGKQPYAGVFYSPRTHFWYADDTAKEHAYLFIEYPTGAR